MDRFMKEKNGLLIIIIYFFVYAFLANVAGIFVGVLSVILGADIGIILFITGFIEVFILIAIIIVSKDILLNDFKNIKILDFIKNTAIFYVILWIASFISSIIVLFLSGSDSSVNQQLIEELTLDNPVYAFFAIVIYAPIVEELVFRGAIFGLIRRKYSMVVATVISTLCFAAMHFTVSFITAQSSDFIHIISYFLIAIPLCLAYEKSKNIYVPILVHLINNLLAFILISLV